MLYVISAAQLIKDLTRIMRQRECDSPVDESL